jgi:hypothetical protein
LCVTPSFLSHLLLNRSSAFSLPISFVLLNIVPLRSSDVFRVHRPPQHRARPRNART